jgi:hypothetical protein
MNPSRASARRRAASLGAAAVLSLALLPGAFASAAKPPPKPPKPKPPPAGGAGQLSIATTPRVIVFGAGSAVAGQLTGVPNAVGVALSLDQSTYPFKSFKRLAAGSTAAGGAYTFAVTPPGNTRYRVTAQTSPRTTSAEVDVLVKKRVTIGARGRRISGLVAPAHNGDPVQLQRRSRGGYRTMATGRLTDAGTGGGRYHFTVQRSGVYRARAPGDADHLSGTSSSRRVS